MTDTAPAPTIKIADELDRHFLHETSNGLLADVMVRDARGRIIYIPLNARTGEHWYRNRKVEYWEKMVGVKTFARQCGEDAVNRAFEAEKKETGDIKKLYEVAGRAFKRCRTKDFLNGSISLFNEYITVKTIAWNATPECLPLLDGILDYSGSTPVKRKAREGEYYKDPLPYEIDDVLSAEHPKKWDALLHQIHPNEENRKMARQCMAIALRGEATKLFQVWFNREGNGGKNTVIDALGVVLPERVKAISSAVILKGGDSSERRFGAAEMEGNLINFFDEVG